MTKHQDPLRSPYRSYSILAIETFNRLCELRKVRKLLIDRREPHVRNDINPFKETHYYFPYPLARYLLNP